MAPQTSFYGYNQSKDVESSNLTTLKGIQDAAKSSKIISSSTLKKIQNDPLMMAFYLNAFTYGGYNIGDIVSDMARYEMELKGDSRAKALTIIDSEKDRDSYYSEPEGIKAQRETQSLIPEASLSGMMDSDLLSYGSNMPDDVFKMLVPIVDDQSEAFKDAVANIKSAFYDMANAQLQAQTEQEKAIADQNYKQFKEQIEREYGIKLSDNADAAWKQIEGLEDSYNTRGLAGSGMQNEAIDSYLNQTRKGDQRARDAKLTTEEARRGAELRASGTEEQIAALSDEEKEKWGLKPSAEILAMYDMNTLREKFPDQSDEELQAYRDAVLDKNGNYRSTLYKNYYTNVNANNVSKKSLAEGIVRQEALDKEKNAYLEYDKNQISGQLNKTTPDAITNGLTKAETPAGEISDADFIQKMKDLNIDITQDQIDSVRKSGALNTTAPTPTNVTTQKPPAPSNTASYTTQQVKNLQDYLVSKGIMTQAQVNTGYGTFGPQTTAALNKYQTQTNSSLNVAGLTPKVSTNNPVYGPVTDPNKTSTTTKNYTPYVAPKATTTPPVSTYKPTTTTTTKPTAPKTGYQGSSIVDYLNSTGGDSSYAARAKLGGSGYTGTAAQNTALLKQLRGY